MKTFILASLMGLFALVTSEPMLPSPESPSNISVLDTFKRDALPIDFAVSSPSDPAFLVHTADISDADYQKAVCRGQKLFLAMTRDSTQGTRYINPLITPWDGTLEKEGLIWAWDNWLKKDLWCTFNEEGLSNAFKGLSINDIDFDF